jgi:SIR2-like domain
MDEQLPPAYYAKIEILAKSLLNDRCLIFLGAGAARSEDPRLSLPSGANLAQEMAGACQLQFPEYVPLSTVAFFYESRYNRAYLNDFLKAKIDLPDLPVPETMQTVAKIIRTLEKKGKQCFVITTNYDCLFERAYKEATGKELAVVVYRGGWDPHDRAAKLHLGLDMEEEYWHPKQQTTLYKMHGCIKDVTDSTRNKSCLVITEEDYINFITNALSQDHAKRVVQHARGVIALSNILFLGYSLSDSDFRVIFKATAEARMNDSYAIQYFNGNEMVHTQLDRARWVNTRTFWQKKEVQIIDCPASRFVTELFNELQKQVGNE